MTQIEYQENLRQKILRDVKQHPIVLAVNGCDVDKFSYLFARVLVTVAKGADPSLLLPLLSSHGFTDRQRISPFDSGYKIGRDKKGRWASGDVYFVSGNSDTWCYPLDTEGRLLPDAPGQFGAVRKNDIHTGVDLYCELGTRVHAVECGKVIGIENFTGPNAEDPSPWWNDTQAILIEGTSGVVVYGEVGEVKVAVGDGIYPGQHIATITTSVLKKYKGRPQVMLHLELLKPEATKTVWWKLDEPQPDVLLDPTPFLLKEAGDRVKYFDLTKYDGIRYKSC